MKKIKVKDIMVPLSEYATVSEEATLYEAVIALEEARRDLSNHRYPHKAVLVYGEGKKIVGKLSQMDVIRGLESGYGRVGDIQTISEQGFSPELIRSVMEKYGLWQGALEDVCRKASRIKVKTIMYTPTEGEYVAQEATMDEAIHRLIMSDHKSLVVTDRGGDIVGVLRLSDVFSQVSKALKACQV